ncbi:MAG TPA: CmcJ/NvfI family oxidoreductase [Pseudomonadales bacterium]|nr:CmcJ/NvfI family oxidoreductase [Pseudomonadales bacterium]
MDGQVEVWCETTLNFSEPGREEPIPVPVQIIDARSVRGLELERCGFTLLQHESAVDDWRDEAELASVHAKEIRALAKKQSGAHKVIVYPPIVRSPRTAARVEDYAPIHYVHSDFTDDFRAMVEDPSRPYAEFITPLLAEQGLTQADVARASRVLMLQFWRNIGDEWPDCPLAVCDGRDVPRARLHAFVVPEYGGRRIEFETFGVRPPATPDADHWYTYPGMTQEEVLVLRTYDSRCVDKGWAFWTPHSAFVDPTAGPEAPRRESVEMRALCLFGV